MVIFGPDRDLCAACRYKFALGSERVPCPECGSAARTFIRDLAEELPPLRDAVSYMQRRPGFPGLLVSAIERYKTSRRGVPAHEHLIIDRSDPDKSVKTHFLEEQQPDGSWAPVPGHDPEVVEWPAKTPRPDPPHDQP